MLVRFATTYVLCPGSAEVACRYRQHRQHRRLLRLANGDTYETMCSSAGPSSSTDTTSDLSPHEPFSSSVLAIGKMLHPYPIIPSLLTSVYFRVLGTGSDIVSIPPLDTDESPKPAARRGR
jgi:hypothetical protein